VVSSFSCEVILSIISSGTSEDVCISLDDCGATVTVADGCFFNKHKSSTAVATAKTTAEETVIIIPFLDRKNSFKTHYLLKKILLYHFTININI
ncbi:MAG: hypothetical protein II334_00530, partial [Clostridia bacterium]|nr:hypothetical protein [Clostridia bacterium]